MPKINMPKGFLFGIILFIGLAAGIPLILSQSQVRQVLTGQAWYLSQSATAGCVSTSTNIFIKVSLTNEEASKNMIVKATDNQSGKSIDLGTVTAGKTKTGLIDTGLKTLNSGQVTFNFAWTDNPSDKDTSTAGYSKVSRCTGPTPTTAITTPTPTPKTTTPTPTVLTPTPTTATSSATPTTCPTPETVKNIKIQCPYCTPSPTQNQ